MNKIEEALANLVDYHLWEDSERDENHLWYTCDECGEEAQDDKNAIQHDEECNIGQGATVLKGLRR